MRRRGRLTSGLAALAAVAALATAGPALAGPEGDMLVNNATDAPIELAVTPLACMYSDGEDGSHLERFDGLTLPAGTRSSRNTVEARLTGSGPFKRNQYALLQGMLIGKLRGDVSRATMRTAARRLRDADALGGGGNCYTTASLFALLAVSGPRYAAVVVRVSTFCRWCDTKWEIQAQARDGLRISGDDTHNIDWTVSRD